MAMTRRARGQAAQWLLLLALLAVAGWLGAMLVDNLSRRHMGFGFGFLGDVTNFDIPFRLIDWTVNDTYARALLVCTLNTLLVSAMGIVTATVLGVTVGIMRLSANWLVRNLALWFVELVRNTPQLIQIVFWYVAVLQTLPAPRHSIAAGGALLNIRGVFLPWPVLTPSGGPMMAAAALLLLLAAVLVPARPRQGRWARPVAAVLAIGAVLLAVAATDHLDRPALRGFNIAGGLQVPPELVAVWAGLSVYAAAFIAEIVRAAILSVHKGQREAALSLGLKPGQVLARVVMPQALRVMIPPMTSQYLNLIKSSTLGAAVAYPELYQIFAGTVLTQTGRELENVALLMGIFLAINLIVSAAMNRYNRSVMLVER